MSTIGSTAIPAARGDRASSVGERMRSDPAYQGFMLLRIGFTVAPIVFGLDKFTNVLVDWTQYLAPWINDIIPGSASDAMYLVGVVEIAAGVIVGLKPRYGAYIVAAWLAGIIVNLLTYSGYYDIALRDFGLMLAALGPATSGGSATRGASAHAWSGSASSAFRLSYSSAQAGHPSRWARIPRQLRALVHASGETHVGQRSKAVSPSISAST